MPILTRQNIAAIAPEMNSQLSHRGSAPWEPYAPAEYPICLSTSAQMAMDGSQYVPDAEELQNTYSRAIQIEEMSFLVQGHKSTLVNRTDPGFSVRMSLRMDRHQLTSDGNSYSGGGVPLAMLQPSVDNFLSYCRGGITGIDSANYFNYYKWRLPVPMIVPANGTLQPVFYWQNPDGTTGVNGGRTTGLTIYVTMRGRSLLGAMPQKIKIPFATCYTGKIGATVSSSNDLYNPFDATMNIQRMVARAVEVGAGGAKPYVNEIDLNDEVVQLTDAAGGIINRRRDEFMALFDPQRSAWNMGRQMGPYERYRVEMGTAPSASFIPLISAIGWREEEIY